MEQAFLEQQGLLFEKVELDKQRGRAHGVLTRLLDRGWQILNQVTDPITGSVDITMRCPPTLPSSVSDPTETFTVRWKGIDVEAVHRRADAEVYFLEEVFRGPELHESTAWRRKFLSRYGLSGAIATGNAEESVSLRFLVGNKWPPSRSALVEARLIAALLQGGWEPFEYQVDGIRWHISFHPPRSLVDGDSEIIDLWQELAS